MKTLKYHPRLSEWALNPMTRVLVRYRRGEDREGDEGHVKVEAESGARKECWELSEAGRGREMFFPRAFPSAAP